ncbi:1,4-beta-N-acetylmuramidase [Pediococcus pentosaceus]|uniref:GH25 family lysozyme n=1 Tax=Pediococcus pentosaceus TaxID=1255 RepID=UPI001008FF05|nr:GH25 family lysozyme [Pediococcus pentosaceus]RXI22267.1 1,4-beta-N-acetylmuramidase [Pediococcus pentosaceus]
MKKLNKLSWVVAIAMAFFIGLVMVSSTTQASTRSQGTDWSKFQGYYPAKAYKSDEFSIAQLGGSYGGTLIDQATYNTQVSNGRAQGLRMHTYLWYGIGNNQYNAKNMLDYYLPKVKTPKGSIVALDYEDGASNNIERNTKAIIYGIRRIKAAGYTPMYYSYKPYTLAHVNYQEIVKEFGNKSLWIAGYADYQVRSKPLYNYFPSMNGVAIWQFTSTYKAGGLDGNVDLTGITKNGYNGQTPTPSKPNKPTKPTNKKDVHVTYALHQKGKKWLNPVKDFGSGSNGFAGVPNSVHDLLYIKVNHGSIKYRVHTKEDGWLPWVHKANRKDTVNGVAGIKGHTIDGVQMYYTTPSGETYQQAYYRSQTTQRANYLGTCADNGTVAGYDSFAGMLGEPLDRLQIHINDNSKY